MTDTLIRQVRYLDPGTNTDQVADVLIQSGRFAAMVSDRPKAIAPHLTDIPADIPVLDGSGCILVPGLVDLYSHSGEPGYEERETLESLAASAIAGGFTRVGILPDTAPPLDNPDALRGFLQRAATLPMTPRPLLLPWAALTQGTAGSQMADLGELADLRAQFTAGTPGLAGCADGHPLDNPVLLRRLLEYLRPIHAPVALWPCDRALAGMGVARAGALAQVAGLAEQPVAAEAAALAALLELVAEIGTTVHIMRVSTARSVALLAQAKAQGLPITASVSWLHLLFSTQDVLNYDPHLRLDPPLGNPADQAALIAGVKAGVIDAIAVDHTPQTYEDKTVPFDQAPAGAIGLELAWATLWQRFVVSGDWSPLTLVQALSTRPAQCLELTPAAIAPGAPAEAFLFNPTERWSVTAANLRSRSHNTPFFNHQLSGRVLQVWVP
ncbi:dihydroorotase [Leptolyngbya sp. PCC 6406]|uniref:dihydroorotase n=1 Tax=Leptolyngbya sp. PCC 6406 TaxID=1173264 RepID=UPI0002ACF339|nr:dihydroorotase [Leptolyngbya sp. PCC 6406]